MIQSNRNGSRLYVMLCGTVIVLTIIALMGLIALGIVRHMTPEPTAPETDGDGTGVTTTAPAAPDDTDTTASVEAPDDPPSTPASPTVLAQTADMGQAYQDSIVFVGDSTTAHLRSRGVLTGGKNTEQVWVPSDNTLLLDLNITQKRIVYPATGQEMTIAEAAAAAKPAYMVLTVGLNGVTSFVNNKNLYQNCYGKLIEAIREASPETRIMLQSVFPVAQNQTTFSVDAATLNGYIDTLNTYVLELAEKYDLRYLDTASVLKDADGNLPHAYQNGDGIHLTADGYRVILDYIRTHGYQ